MVHSGTFVVERSLEDVYGLLADPQRFAPLMPDYESMVMQDATHFQLRTVLDIGQIRGHANLAMELSECVAPSRVKYQGTGNIAGSQLRFSIEFSLNAPVALTEVQWTGEVVVDGMLAFMAAGLIESKGRSDFERMAERLRTQLTQAQPSPESEPNRNNSA